MTDLQEIIGLLYRADWTRLSMSADVRFERDGDLLLSRLLATRPPWFPKRPARTSRENPEGGPVNWEEELPGYHSGRARLLIAPGGRYRQEYGDEPSGQVTGSDGERDWTWHQPDQAPPPLLIGATDKSPFRELFCPSGLLGGFTLEVRGPVTALGRDAIAVAPTARTRIRYGSPLLAGSLSDHLEVIVDAELGILLSYEETFEGQRLIFTELTAVVLDPPEAADPSKFAPPAASRISPDPWESMREKLSGPDRQAAKIATGLVAGGLGALIRLTPHRPDRQNLAEADAQAAMPSAEPAALETEGGPPLPDDLLYLLHRSGENPAFTATLHEWQDVTAMTAQVPDWARAGGHGGVGYLVDSVDAATHGKPVAGTMARLSVGGREKYRVDYLSRSGQDHRPKVIACDGEQRWLAYATQMVIGPAGRPPDDIAKLVDSSWLLGCRLSGGAEISYHGRRAYQLSAAKGGDGRQAAPLLFFPADAIVDAELGCLLRLISFAGDRPASWWELSDLGTEPVPAGEFRLEVPPGVRVVEATGNPITDTAAVWPGATGCAVRTAADVVRRTSDAVSATRSFLDDLRGRTRT